MGVTQVGTLVRRVGRIFLWQPAGQAQHRTEHGVDVCSLWLEAADYAIAPIVVGPWLGGLLLHRYRRSRIILFRML